MRAGIDTVTTADGTFADRGDEMRDLSGKNLSCTAIITTSEIQGFAGWLLGFLRDWRGQRQIQRKQLRLIETLSLGGKRQLMLVSCAGESFLVGGGMDSVETILRLKAEVSVDDVVKSLDATCQ